MQKPSGYPQQCVLDQTIFSLMSSPCNPQDTEKSRAEEAPRRTRETRMAGSTRAMLSGWRKKSERER